MSLRVERVNNVPHVFVYGDIGKRSWWNDGADLVSARDMLETLEAVGPEQDLVIRINSPGGDVFEAIAIYQTLSRRDGAVRVEVDALAASAASVIAMAGDDIVMAGNAILMIHRAWTMALGNTEDLQQAADALKKTDQAILTTYVARTRGKSSEEEIQGWMNSETWMTAEESVARGFADRVGELQAGVAASVAQGRYQHAPAHLLRHAAGVTPSQDPVTAPATEPPVRPACTGIRQRLQAAQRLRSLKTRGHRR